MQNFKIHTLSNGLRLVWEGRNTKVAHAGLMVEAGSRHELENENGLAHFIEHTLFKGTKKMRSRQIINALETVGGELNAYTSKEETCIYASMPALYDKKAIDLIADILNNSVFPEVELVKEREVVLDEILSYKDTPSERIFDDFEELFYPNQAVGRNILGTEKSVRSFTQKEIMTFLHRNYSPEKMVFSYVGPTPFETIKNRVEHLFSEIPFMAKSQVLPQAISDKFWREQKEHVVQAHCIIGGQAPSIKENDRIPFALLSNILGGSGMNSILNIELREKHGLTYNNEANYTALSDSGLFEIYFGTDQNYFDKSLKIVRSSLSKLCSQPIGSLKLKQSKAQFIGQSLLLNESGQNRMLSAGKALLSRDSLLTPDEWENAVNSITSEKIQNLAIKYIKPNTLSSLIFKPKSDE